MRISLTLGGAVVVLALCVFPACSSSTPGPAIDTDAGTSSGTSGSTDSGTATEGGSSSGDSGTSGDCAGADPATVGGLGKILGGWKWSKDIVGGSDQELPDCDKRIGYFIGPDVASDDYPKCAVARGEVVPIRGGNYATTATGCTDLVCSKIGLLMANETTARVFALDGSGKPTGQPAFFFTIAPNATMSDSDLVQSNTGSTTTGKRMSRQAGVPTCK